MRLDYIRYIFIIDKNFFVIRGYTTRITGEIQNTMYENDTVSKSKVL